MQDFCIAFVSRKDYIYFVIQASPQTHPHVPQETNFTPECHPHGGWSFLESILHFSHCSFTLLHTSGERGGQDHPQGAPKPQHFVVVNFNPIFLCLLEKDLVALPKLPLSVGSVSPLQSFLSHLPFDSKSVLTALLNLVSSMCWPIIQQTTITIQFLFFSIGTLWLHVEYDISCYCVCVCVTAISLFTSHISLFLLSGKDRIVVIYIIVETSSGLNAVSSRTIETESFFFCKC